MKLERITQDDILDTRYITEISETTGEVITYTKAIYNESGKEKLENNKIIKLSEKELHQYLKEEVGNFFFYFYNVLDECDIKPQYKVRFLYLASYLDYNNNLLVAKSEYNCKIQLNRQMVKDILKLKESEFKNTIKTLLDNGLMLKDGIYYKLNTSYSIKGCLQKKSREYTRVFIRSIRELYDKCEPKQHKQLYYIFKMLPHVNVNFNIPCKNIDDDVMSNIDPLKINDICSLIGYDSSNGNKLWNILRSFKIGDNYVVCKHVVDESEYIAINPKLYYAGTRMENVKHLIGIFEMSRQG